MPNWLTINILMLSTLSLMLTGCAKQQLASQADIELEVAKQAQSTTVTVEEIIQQAIKNLENALNDELDFYAPLHITHAKENLEQAQAQLESPPKDIKNAALMSAIATNKLIEKAYENKQTITTHLKDTFASKTILDKLEMDAKYQPSYHSIKEDIKDLVKQFEAGQTKEAVHNQRDVISNMTRLEIEILLDRHLTPALKFLAKAEDINAEDYAPLSFKAAQNSIESSRHYIQTNNRNRTGIERSGKKALEAAQKAYFMAKDVKPLINMLPEETEAHINTLLNKLAEMNSKISQEALPPQPYQNAIGKISELITLLQQQNKSLSAQLAEATNQLESLKVVENTENENSTAIEIYSDPVVLSEPLNNTTEEWVEMEDEPVLSQQ